MSHIHFREQVYDIGSSYLRDYRVGHLHPIDAVDVSLCIMVEITHHLRRKLHSMQEAYSLHNSYFLARKAFRMQSEVARYGGKNLVHELG